MRQKKVVEISEFNNDNVALVKGFYNYNPTKALRNSYGIKNATFPQNATKLTEKELKISSTGIEKVKGVAYFKQYYRDSNRTVHRLLVYGSDNKIYINQLLDDTWDLFWLYGLTANSAPMSLMYKKDDEDIMILASDDQMYLWKVGYSPYIIEEVPIITSMCMNEGVLFCTVKDPAYKVWYAMNIEADRVGNISNTSGYISLDDELGDAKKVIVFNQDVYVFRDYGISKINYLKEDKSVSQIYKTNTRIYCNTISVCGNSILFMTKEGLYSFNGIKVSKLDIKFFSDFNVKNDGAVASTLGEKYYLALRYDFNDGKQILCEAGEFVNNVLVIIDTSDMSHEVVRGVDIGSFAPVQTEVFEKMLVTFNSGYENKIGEISKQSICVEENLPKYWESSSVVNNFNTKLVTKISAYAEKDVKLTLVLDGAAMEFVCYESGLNEFSFKACAKDVKLKISSNAESAVVEKVIIEYYEY